MKVNYIELLGEKHPLCLSLSAVQALDEAFGGIDEMQKGLLNGSLAGQAAAADKTLQILLKAGRIYASACGEELPPPLPCRPADVIDVRDGKALKAIFATISADTDREVEAEVKNGEATPGD